MRKEVSTFAASRGLGGGLLLVLLLVLVGCGSSQNNGSPTVGKTPTAITPAGSVVSTAVPVSDGVTPVASVKFGTQPCPDAVSAPSYWDAIIGTNPNISKVESVTCANLIGQPTLQALINERFEGTGSYVSVYVYDKITAAHPLQLLKLQGLEHGDAKVSGYNTIITGEVDDNTQINLNKPNAGLTRDLYREFKWSDGAGKFVPAVFPGIFPDLTRYQAEADQQSVSQGHQPWKLSATMTASAFAVSMLKWPPNSPVTVGSGGGQNDLNAVVTVKNPNAGFGGIQVAMTRLEGNTKGGIWVVTTAASAGMSLTAPEKLSTLTSPVTVSGTGNAFEGVIGTLAILDHNTAAIGHASAHGAVGNGKTTFSTSVPYTKTYTRGAHEGMIALYANSNAGDGIAGAVMLKVLLT